MISKANLVKSRCHPTPWGSTCTGILVHLGFFCPLGVGLDGKARSFNSGLQQCSRTPAGLLTNGIRSPVRSTCHILPLKHLHLRLLLDLCLLCGLHVKLWTCSQSFNLTHATTGTGVQAKTKAHQLTNALLISFPFLNLSFLMLLLGQIVLQNSFPAE